MITENLVDQPFLDKYCVGYDEKTLPASAPKNSDYKSYILGLGEDGVEKTPEWASKITGIPVDTIVKLGREMGTAKPCAIHQGWGLQRTANGELACRAIAMLSLLTALLVYQVVLQVLVKVTSTFHLFASLLCQTQLKLLSRCSCGQMRFTVTMK